MKTTQCVPFNGSEKRFQDHASAQLEAIGRHPALWSWITTTCGTRCVTEDHLRIHAPVRLAYPHSLCIYCGRSAGTRDHLEPRNWTGDARRKFVVTVPACGTCNSLLNDTITTSITERRALAHTRLRKHYRKVLSTLEFTAADLTDFGPTLQGYVRDEIAKKKEVLRMLNWPTDAGYDMRAIQTSGIEDPYVIGLLEDPASPQMLSHVASVA